MSNNPSKRPHQLEDGDKPSSKILRVEDEDDDEADDLPADGSSRSSSGSSSSSSSDNDSSSSSSDSEDNEDENVIRPSSFFVRDADSSELASSATTSQQAQLASSSMPNNLDRCPLKSLRDSMSNAGDYDQIFELGDYFTPNTGNGPVDPVFVDEDSSGDAAAVNVDFDHLHESPDFDTSMVSSRNNSPPPPPLPPLPLPAADMPASPEQPPPPPDEDLKTLDHDMEGNKNPVDGEDDGGLGSESDSLDEEEIFAMLEETTEANKNSENRNGGPQERRFNQVEIERYSLVEKAKNHFDVLPNGWVMVPHSSGMPIYLHKYTKVVTLSRPYCIGGYSARRHTIPVTSIPCLNYRRALERESSVAIAGEAATSGSSGQEKDDKSCKPTECDDGNSAHDPSSDGLSKIPQASLQEATEVQEKISLGPEEVREYCQRLFQFKKTTHKRFRNWIDHRRNRKAETARHTRAVKEATESTNGPNRAVLPKGTKIITIPVVEMESINDEVGGKVDGLNQKIIRKSKKDWFINPAGKSAVCILHEYLQHSMKQAPIYKFSEVESSSTPYCAVIEINGVEYAKGFGSSKKIAKSEAARLTLEILIPDLRKVQTKNGSVIGENMNDSFFDKIRIEDPRVPHYCNLMSEPSPYAVLVTCLQKNYGIGDTSIKTSMLPARNQRNEFRMKVNQREVSVICKNKRDGKQMASQKLLQLLHPNVKSWGSLIRMYGSKAISAQKSKKEKESEVTALQARTLTQSPSKAILEKLRSEMKLLAARKLEVAPIGKLTLPTSYAGHNDAIACPPKIDL